MSSLAVIAAVPMTQLYGMIGHQKEHPDLKEVSMERLCFTLSVVPGTENEFDRRHAEIWPEMTSAMREAGYRNYTLFRRGQTVLGYAECHPDVSTAASIMVGTEVSTRWGESMLGIVEDSPGLTYFEQVWHLSD